MKRPISSDLRCIFDEVGSEREAESIIIFMADKTSAGSWNMPLYKIFADPFNTIGLVIAPNMHAGYSFEVHDVRDHKKITFNAPDRIC